jgi:hypothetical protein
MLRAVRDPLREGGCRCGETSLAILAVNCALLADARPRRRVSCAAFGTHVLRPDGSARGCAALHEPRADALLKARRAAACAVGLSRRGDGCALFFALASVHVYS